MNRTFIYWDRLVWWLRTGCFPIKPWPVAEANREQLFSKLQPCPPPQSPSPVFQHSWNPSTSPAWLSSSYTDLLFTLSPSHYTLRWKIPIHERFEYEQIMWPWLSVHSFFSFFTLRWRQSCVIRVKPHCWEGHCDYSKVQYCWLIAPNLSHLLKKAHLNLDRVPWTSHDMFRDTCDVFPWNLYRDDLYSSMNVHRDVHKFTQTIHQLSSREHVRKLKEILHMLLQLQISQFSNANAVTRAVIHLEAVFGQFILLSIFKSHLYKSIMNSWGI